MIQCFIQSALVLLLAATSMSAAEPGTSLLVAAKDGDLAAVRTLVNQKGDVNAAEADGTTALHWAVHHGDPATSRR